MLIGKSGENIKSIMDEFDVNVQVPGKIFSKLGNFIKIN